MLPRLAHLAAAALLAAGASTAGAVSPPSASGQLVNFQIMLVDLDPDDGVAPSLVLADGFIGSGSGSEVLFARLPASMLAGASATGSSGPYTGVGTVTAGNPGVPGQGPGSAASLFGQGVSNVQLEAALTHGAFTLSARTSATLTAMAQAQVGTGLVDRGLFAGANFTVWEAAPGLTVGPAPQIFAVSGLGVYGSPDVFDTGWQQLTLTIGNATADTLGGNLYIGAYASNFYVPPPVPEPAQWALLAAGLALLLPVARRSACPGPSGPGAGSPPRGRQPAAHP